MIPRPMVFPGGAAWLLAVVGLALLPACSGAPYQVAAVSGRVTLDGRPLAGASVTFQPVGGRDRANPGPGSYAQTDADGRYTLRTVEPEQPGAVVGRHKVYIAAQQALRLDDDAGGPVNELLPTMYRSGELEYDVPAEGTTTADFAIESPPR